MDFQLKFFIIFVQQRMFSSDICIKKETKIGKNVKQL